MKVELKDLKKLQVVAKKTKKEPVELLLEALEGKLQLFSLANEDKEVVIIPCKKEWIEEEGFFIDVHNQDDAVRFCIEIGMPLRLNEAAIKGLIVNNCFSEVELFRALGQPLDDSTYEYWRASDEHYQFINKDFSYTNVSIDRVYCISSEVENLKITKSSHRQDNSTNTALKVIGLLMHHLAKSPKYARGEAPNKSEVKKLLLNLAVELNIDSYGLNKVDERLLSNALSYLEEQKL